jgi:Domain of unknown function (DUF4129)
MSDAKRNSLVLLTLTAILTLFLAMSLSHLVLAPGQPFALDQSQPAVVAASAPLEGSDTLLWILRGFLALTLIFLPVYIIYSLRTPQGRRRLLANVIMLLALLWITDQLQKQMLEQAVEQQKMMMNTPTNMEGDSSIPVAVFPAEPPAWVTIMVIAAASLLAVGVIFSGFMLYRQRAKPPELVLDKLAEAAQNTIQSIYEGGDFKLSIIQCYREMSRVVREEKGIARDIAMTPREFEDVLISRGLPSTSIDTLTRLFEQVRYGSMSTAPGDQDLAIACLTEIVEVCRPRDSLYES